MLTVKGQLLSISSRTARSKTDNSSYTFYTGYFLGPLGGRPTEVSMGTNVDCFEVGQVYEVEVYVRAFALRDGGVGWQLLKSRDGYIGEVKKAA